MSHCSNEVKLTEGQQNSCSAFGNHNYYLEGNEGSLINGETIIRYSFA